MGKAVLVAVWITLGQPAVVQQIEVGSLDKCEALAKTMTADATRGTQVTGSPSFMAYCVSR